MSYASQMECHRSSDWTYRWSTITDERRLVVRCPIHPERYDEEYIP